MLTIKGLVERISNHKAAAGRGPPCVFLRARNGEKSAERLIIDGNDMVPYYANMPTNLLYLRDLPKHETLAAAAKEYPDIDPDAVESYLFLLRAASDMGAASQAYLEKHGISRGRFTVLVVLNSADSKGLCPAELAEKSGVTRATMTGLLDGLERDGLVQREGHLDDRRMLMVKLTSKGKSFFASVLPGYVRGISALMAPLGVKDKQQLAGLLAKLCDHVGRAPRAKPKARRAKTGRG